MSTPNQPENRALLLHFSDAKCTEASNTLGRTLERLDCIVINHRIQGHDSAAATGDVTEALEKMKRAIQSPEEKIIIHYIGHAFQWGTDSEDDQFWWLGDNECCLNHAVRVDVNSALEEFLQDSEIKNEILLIFHCPINIYRHFKIEMEASSCRSKRSVQMLYFPEEITKLHSCNKTLENDEKCPVQMMLVRTRISTLPTVDLATELGGYFGKTATVATLLDSLTHTASKQRTGPYHRQLLGETADFVLSRMTQLGSVVPVAEPAQPVEEKKDKTQGDSGLEALGGPSGRESNAMQRSDDASIRSGSTLFDVDKSDTLLELERRDGVEE